MTLDGALILALRAAAVYLPAGELAELLHTPREMVAARVNGLREAGFEIDERPGLGYRLLASPDRLIADDLRARLGTSKLVRDILVFGETDSTNERATQLGRHGARGGVAIFAERQTAGRGRFGRRWESAAHRGLWFSLLLRPDFPPALWPRLTTWAAVAVAEAVEETLSVTSGIKWPNDVLLHERKVAGILIEAGSDEAGEPFAVVGIGVNVNHEKEDLPAELRNHATSLRLAAGVKVDRPAFAAALLQVLERRFADMENGFEALVEQASRRSSLLGRWITVTAGGSALQGSAEALDGDGRLMLRAADGALHLLNAGEATLADQREL